MTDRLWDIYFWADHWLWYQTRLWRLWNRICRRHPVALGEDGWPIGDYFLSDEHTEKCFFWPEKPWGVGYWKCHHTCPLATPGWTRRKTADLIWAFGAALHTVSQRIIRRALRVDRHTWKRRYGNWKETNT